MKVEAAFWQPEKRTDHDFDTGADVGFFRLLKLLIRPSAGSRSLYHIVDGLSQKDRYLPFNRSEATRTRNKLVTNVGKLIEIWMTLNNLAGWHRYSQFLLPWVEEDYPNFSAMEA